MVCIWCKSVDPNPSIEHVIPEALGCPPGLELRDGQVCTRCNNALGHVDQAVVNDFDFMLFINAVPRKGGKPPVITGRGNVCAWHDAEGGQIRFNMESSPVAVANRRLSPFRSRTRDIKVATESVGSEGRFHFQTQLASSPKFARGLYKIALSLVAFFWGEETALLTRFDWIRKYVTRGDGESRIILTPRTVIENRVWVPTGRDELPELAMITLMGVDFLIDLTRSGRVFDDLKDQFRKHYGRDGWTTIPPNLSRNL